MNPPWRDPQSRNHIYETLTELNAAGMTILLSTHIMEEAQRLCSSVTLADKGAVIFNGPMSEMIFWRISFWRRRPRVARRIRQKRIFDVSFRRISLGHESRNPDRIVGGLNVIFRQLKELISKEMLILLRDRQTICFFSLCRQR